MENLTETVKNILINSGACKTGFLSKESLDGGPPSADLSYVLPEAKYAISFAVALNQDFIEPFLAKKDHKSHNDDNIYTNTLASGISLEVVSFLIQKGFNSVPLTSNLVYRDDTKHGRLDETPPISHRYLAVRSGIGHFGYSGNVITKDYGAAVILGSVITEAEFEPTEPLSEESNYCNSCRLCLASCASGFMSNEGLENISLGGKNFSYSKRRHHNRCDYVCGGFTGLHQSRKWSTWSAGRFPVPDSDEEFLPQIIKTLGPYTKRTAFDRCFYNIIMPGYKTEFTCGNCQLICHPDKEVRKQRYQMLVNSGVIIQDENNNRKAVTPQEAEKFIEQLPPERKALFEVI